MSSRSPRKRTRAAGLASALVVLLAGVSSAAADVTWHQVGTGTTGGISGAAASASGWVVVRDNKSSGQNRIALLDDDGQVTPLTWPGTAPSDLEALAGIPGSSTQYAALTSAGKGSIVSISGSTVTLVRTFTVPRGSSNIESFALTQIGGSTVAVWATRGSSSQAAKVWAATFTPSSGSFGSISSGTVTVPFPTTSVRHIADLAVSAGVLTGPATSDPGANGPFTSALYEHGTVALTGGKAVLSLHPPTLLATYPGHKVEGLACGPTTSLLGTDDENLGGWMAIEPLCG